MQPLRMMAICTGNICRSPVAAAALQRHLDARGVPATVTSSGVRGGGQNDPATIKAARTRDYDISGHRSRRVDRHQLRTEGSDLVIAMTRGHVVDLAEVDPHGFAKTFTLAELVRSAEALPPDTRVATFSEWRDLVGADRTPFAVLAASAVDDIADPHRRRMKHHRAAVERVDELAERFAELLSNQLVIDDPRDGT